MVSVAGTAGNDFIHMADDGLGLPFGYNDIAQTTDAADSITAGFGDDYVYAYGGNDVITGAAGNDFIDGGTGNDNVNAGDGNDQIIGGAGTDNLVGGDGQDVFIYRQLSEISGLAEKVNGGNDYDRMDFASNGTTGALDLSKAIIQFVEELDLGAGTDVTLTADQLGGFSKIAGTFGAERLILAAPGTADLTGATLSLIDEIRGSAGDDTITLTGVGEGQTVNALDGTDTIAGGSGNDAIDGGAGNDVLSGDTGNDVLTGGIGIDTLIGGDGNDVLLGGASADTLEGDAGNDIFRYQFVGDVSGSTETINGGADYDRIDFNTLAAHGAVDLSSAVIFGIEELDLDGNDVTMTAAQFSAIKAYNGSFASDHLILSARGGANFTGATFNLIDGIIGSTGNDAIVLTNVATALSVDGGDGNDNIVGTLAGDTLTGGNGNDTINGSDGNDTIFGGQGADALTGGVGYDVFRIQQGSDISGLAESINGGSDVDRLDFATGGATGPIDLSLATITSVEELDVGNNDITLTAAQLSNFTSIIGGFGTERMILSAPGTVNLTNHTLSLIDELRGSTGDDSFTLTGVAQGQYVNALDGNDTVTGGNGNDSIDGGAGNDTLAGGAGDDLIIGGAGVDRMTGGAGADTFRFLDISEAPKGATRDVITDFTHGADVIDLSAIDANSELAGNQAFSYIGAAAFSHTAGELELVSGQLMGDINGDGVADFQITLAGAPSVTATDFIL